MPSGEYKLQSTARPGRFISLLGLDIVGQSADAGGVIEWFAKFEKDELASLRAVRPGAIYDLFISYDSETKSLKASQEPWFFTIKASPREPSFFYIEVTGVLKVFALTSWDEGTPIELQRDTGATQQLWLLDEVKSAE